MILMVAIDDNDGDGHLQSKTHTVIMCLCGREIERARGRERKDLKNQRKMLEFVFT